MKQIVFDLNFVRLFVYKMSFMGFVLIILGVGIFVYPNLLAILVSVGLIVSGISILSFAHRINRYSQVKIGKD